MEGGAQAVSQLKRTALVAFGGGTFLMLLGTGIIWAGSEDFGTTPLPWVAGLIYTGVMALVIPVLYLLFRQESPLWVHGVMGFLGGLVPAASVFGMGAHFFYFGFAPMPRWISLLGLIGGAALMIHWAYKVAGDVMEALHKKHLFGRAYIEEGSAYYYSWGFMQEIEDVQHKRDPFKSYHLWFALALTPFTLVLNRVLTPYTGSGHGVFIVLSILGLPMSLWIVGMAVRAYILMIHYPIKLQRQTGKPVLMRDFD